MLAGVSLDQVRAVVRDEVTSLIKPIQKGLAIVLSEQLDPWENIRSTATDLMIEESGSHLAAVSEYYGTPQKYFCMVLGKATDCDIICAHIWPAHTHGMGMEAFDLKPEGVNAARNFLRLQKDIEKAFDAKRLYFELASVDDDSLHLSVRIVDPNLKTEQIRVGDATSPALLFSAIDGREFAHTFAPDKLPYKRLLAAHAMKTIQKAKSLGWINDDVGYTARRARCFELARLSLGEGSNTLKALFRK